jgi:hypothetical protein
VEFLCPIQPGAALPAWHLAVHLGLTTVVTVTGSALLVRGILAYRRTADEGATSPAVGPDGPASPGRRGSIARAPMPRPRISSPGGAAADGRSRTA